MKAVIQVKLKTKFIVSDHQGDVFVPVVNETLADAKKAAHAAELKLHQTDSNEGGDSLEG